MKTNKRNAENKRNNGGFSLVELIVVIAIMAVLVAVAAPQFTKYIDRSRQSVDAQTVSGIVTAAQVGISDVTEYKQITKGRYVITVNKTETKVTGEAVTTGETVDIAAPSDTAKDEMERAITDACGALSELKLTATAWDSVVVEITVDNEYTVDINYATPEFAEYIGK